MYLLYVVDIYLLSKYGPVFEINMWASTYYCYYYYFILILWLISDRYFDPSGQNIGVMPCLFYYYYSQ